MTKGAFSILILAALILMVVPITSVQAFVEPTDVPPGGTSVAPPLNTSANTQTKRGNLTLDGTNPVRLEIGNSAESNNQLCLNGVCITSLVVQDYIRLQGASGSATPGTAQSGFASLQAKSSQQFALRGQGAEPVDNWTTGLLGVVSTSSTGANERYGVLGRTMYDSEFSYGVYGYAQYASAYAGYFEGRVRVTGDLFVGSQANPKRICLNDPGDSSQCITQWPFSETEQFVRLQKTDSPTQDPGSLNVAGSGTFSSVVLGTPVDETPMTVTCGDGVCQGAISSPDETAVSCPQDCFTIQNVVVQTFVTSATIAWNTGVQATTGDVDYGLSTFYTSDAHDPNFSTTHGPLTLSGLLADTTYFYRITSISVSGAVASYPPIGVEGSFTTLSADSIVPSQVLNLRTNGSVTWNSIPLAWDAATDNIGVLYYYLERDSGSGFGHIGGDITSTTFTDDGLDPDTQYTYRVHAVDTALNPGSASNTLIVRTTVVPADTTPPSVPTALNHNGGAYYDTVMLTWNAATDSGPGASGMKEYNIYRKLHSEPDGEWKRIGTVAATAPEEYTDHGPLVNVREYDYAVTAVDNAMNTSSKSDTHTLTTLPDTIAPSTPGTMDLTESVSLGFFKLSWYQSTDTGGSGLAGYRLYRSDCSTSATPWADTCGSLTFDVANPAWELVTETGVWFVTDDGVTSGHQYRYAVVAYDNAGNVSVAQSPLFDIYSPLGISPNTCTDSATQCDVLNSRTRVCCSGTCDSECGGGPIIPCRGPQCPPPFGE